jgi:hypothetical protein
LLCALELRGESTPQARTPKDRILSRRIKTKPAKHTSLSLLLDSIQGLNKTMRDPLFVFWTGFFATPAVLAFTTPSHITRRPPTQLFGISEWRDLWFDYPGMLDDSRWGTRSEPPPKEICILPFPYNEVCLQGETKQLRLYEDRFIQLFDHSMEKNGGVVAMGLLAESGIIQTVPLCEIEAYNRMEGFGIFVTLRVVGRAQLLNISQQEPYLKGVCRELTDKIPPNLELPNLMASNIENFMLTLRSMEHELTEAADEISGGYEGAEMRRRIQVANLVCRYNDKENPNGTFVLV